MEIKDIYEWKGKSLEDLTLNELSKLEFIYSHIPVELETEFKVNGKDYKYLSDYIDERTAKFFDVTGCDFENIVGKCFMSEYKNVVVKVVGLSKNDREFLFEEFEKCGDEWHFTDYNWLQETVKNDGWWVKEHPEYKTYCITSYTDMNICSESMFLLGKDGNLYVDTTCGGDYCVFKPMKESMFEAIREEAIENEPMT